MTCWIDLELCCVASHCCVVATINQEAESSADAKLSLPSRCASNIWKKKKRLRAVAAAAAAQCNYQKLTMYRTLFRRLIPLNLEELKKNNN